MGYIQQWYQWYIKVAPPGWIGAALFCVSALMFFYWAWLLVNYIVAEKPFVDEGGLVVNLMLVLLMQIPIVATIFTVIGLTVGSAAGVVQSRVQVQRWRKRKQVRAELRQKEAERLERDYEDVVRMITPGR